MNLTMKCIGTKNHCFVDMDIEYNYADTITVIEYEDSYMESDPDYDIESRGII